MRVSQFFGLGKTQPYLDFVDVRLDTDIPVFIDPSALRGLQSQWGHDCLALVQSYFGTVLDRIKAGDDVGAQELLSSLSERNEFHLGYSAGRSQGHGMGAKSATSVWGALSRSKASTTGLLQDLEDTALLIEGIGPDMISDAVCNILRGPLIKYTQEAAAFYDIPLTPGISSGPVWNPEREQWEASLVPLPMTSEGKVILVPKLIVRQKIAYQFDKYYTHYLLPEMQRDELRRSTALVRYLKDRTPRVSKKALREKYGSNKLAVITQTLRFPDALSEYRADMQGRATAAMSHPELAGIEGTPKPNWRDLEARLRSLPVGIEQATAYEALIQDILSAVFYPFLARPTKQHKIHEGRKRVDLTFSNEAREGFFSWLAQHYPSALVFVECKNYGKEIGNPELDQIAGRFSPSRGKFGIIVCRSVADERRILQGCVDTAKDDRGFIVVLTDEDVCALMAAARAEEPGLHEFEVLRRKFMPLINR
ncbi:hypothetical protein ACFJGW_07440 [Burkholderiaceae bacterium UC74_6]